MPAATRRKPKSATKPQPRSAAPPERFGAIDPKSGAWLGRPQSLEDAEVAMDPDRPREKSRVQRVASAVDALWRGRAIGDAERDAAYRWHRDWSRGTGHPLRASEARFLGVSLGGAADAEGISTATLDAATRHREACAAVGPAAAERLVLFCCMDVSLRAAAALLDADGRRVSRNDISGMLIADLERLAQHYAAVDRLKGDDKPSWYRGGRRAAA